MPNKSKMEPLLGLGIVGNSAGHIQQTGESKGLTKIGDINKPQALFPFYIPNAEEKYLSELPYSETHLSLPKTVNAKVQMEPELALKLALTYGQQGEITGLRAISISVINDATYRNANITKLAQKKNWGALSKGLANYEIEIDSFTSGCQLDHFRLCGFHKHHDKWQLCGDDVALNDYSYFYEKILDWLKTQIQTQQEHALLHNIQELLTQTGCPENIIVSIGSTRYSNYGETHQLFSGDQTAVVLYDSRTYALADVVSLLEYDKDLNKLSNEKMIFLHQHIN
ncbi:DUF5718 family protein [Psychromonas sp. KJ10-10]|uniref:DUF5718 family protein n=1 Tax=Psychromonas sp. KJ10-10 TaxID=3391823 RepID=UPI0039B61F2E